MNPSELCLKLVIQLRAMQLFYHQAHNVCGRVSFFSDHGTFGDFYGECEADYDGAAERHIGMYGIQALPFDRIVTEVAAKCKVLPASMVKENKELFQAGLKLEQELQQLGEMIMKQPGFPEGSKNLIAGMLDKSMVRMYKIKRRLA